LRSLGIDVGVRKGHDIVIVEDDSTVSHTAPHVATNQLEQLLREWKPDIVAIDSPPSWSAGGKSREVEKALRRLGIKSFPTPNEETGPANTFFDWMQEGFRLFEAAAGAGYPRYQSGDPRHTAIEVFPHATAAVLAKGLLPSGAHKATWRRSVLESQGVHGATTLRSIDQIDAALAALTGLRALQGAFVTVGDPDEGVIVLPVTELEDRYLRLEPAPIATLIRRRAS
jgi:predicted nuclease with RNAse H fold